ncbi:hypothetical protein B0H13DRAFT_1902116 [Mycena leptocephala]|nr:hypothetical protein B0H13DRAFT_1902116 [Mycena leptocephala]
MTSALGDEKYAQAHFSAKRANGLAKPSNGLASRSAGLGLGATLKSKPKPKKARLRGRKPVLQAEKLTLQPEMIKRTSRYPYDTAVHYEARHSDGTADCQPQGPPIIRPCVEGFYIMVPASRRCEEVCDYIPPLSRMKAIFVTT